MTQSTLKSPFTFLLYISFAGTVLSSSLSQGATIWATPSKDKPVEVLCIGPMSGLSDFLDLADQIPMKLTTLGVKSSLNPVLLDDEYESLETALEKNNSVDLVIIANVRQEGLNRDELSALRKLIQNGAGLIWVRFDSVLPESLESIVGRESQRSAELNSELSRGLVREWGSLGIGQHVRQGSIGKGQFVDIEILAPAPLFHNLIPNIAGKSIARDAEYDDIWSFYSRCIRSIMERTPEVNIVGLVDLAPKGPDLINTPPQLPRKFIQASIDSAITAPVRTFELFFSEPLPKKYELQIQLRYPDRDLKKIYAWDETVPKGTKSLPILVPAGLGTSWVDVFLMDGKNIVDWYTHTSVARGWPEIEGLRFPRIMVQPNDSYEVTFSVRKRLESNQSSQILGNEFVYALLRATDAYGRIVGETQKRLNLNEEIQTVAVNWTDALGKSIHLDLFVDEARQGQITNWHEEQGAYANATLVIQQPETAVPFYLAMDGVIVNEPNNLDELELLSRNGLEYLVVDSGSRYGPAAILNDLNQIPRVRFLDYDPSLRFDRWLMEQQSMAVRENTFNHTLSVLQELKLYRQSIIYIEDSAILRAIQRARSIADEELGYQFVGWLKENEFNLSYLRDRWGVELEFWSDVHLATENPDRKSKVVADIRKFLHVKYLRVLEELLSILRNEIDGLNVVFASSHSEILGKNLGNFDTYRVPYGKSISAGKWFHHVVVEPEDESFFEEPSLQLWHQFFERAKGVWFRPGKLGYEGADGSLTEPARVLMSTFTEMKERFFPILEGFTPIIETEGLARIESHEKRTGVRYDFASEQRFVSAWLPDLGNPYKEKSVLVRAPENRYVYEMATGMVIEPGKKRNFSYSSDEPLLLSTLRYSVSRLVVDAIERVSSGKRVTVSLSVRTTDDLPGDHWIQMQVRGPDGDVIRHYSRAIDCPQGQGETILSLAMNEKPGRYTLEFRDVLTGITVQKTMEVFRIR